MKQIFYIKETAGIKKPSDLFNHIEKININYTQENFIVFYLDTKNQIIKEEVLFKGGLNACIICPKTLFRNALINNSNSVIIAHNHPSDSLTPSDEDIKIFKTLKEMGETLDLNVLDSVIFNPKNYYSMTE